ARMAGGQGAEASHSMKPIPISLSPTRSRALNVFLGAVLMLASILLFLALATYRPSDPSMNTATVPERRAAAGLRAYGISGAGVDGRAGMELDAFAGRRDGDSALDGSRAGGNFYSGAFRAAAVALAVDARSPGGRRDGASHFRTAGGVPQYS